MSSFGEEIKRERELREISLREVAESTKINMRYLTALERNEFEHLPGGIFNRGFVRSYAEFIGIDPDAMVNAYLLEEQSQKTQGKGRDRDVMRRPEGSPSIRRLEENAQPQPSPGARRVLLAVALILVVAAVLWGARQWLGSKPAVPSSPVEATPVPKTTPPEGDAP